MLLNFWFFFFSCYSVFYEKGREWGLSQEPRRVREKNFSSLQPPCLIALTILTSGTCEYLPYVAKRLRRYD